MLICILGLYVLSARTRLRLAVQLRTRAARLAAQWGPLRRLAPPRRGVPGRIHEKHGGVSPQEE
jgi:hypothetical protein